YAVVPSHLLDDCTPENLEDSLERWQQALPLRAAAGTLIQYPWDLIEHQAEQLSRDLAGGLDAGAFMADAPHAAGIGPPRRLYAHATARVEQHVVVDTTRGPVVLDAEAVVQAFSRIEGPCYVGPQTQLLGAKVRGCTFGPVCRIGGEVEAAVVQGYSNKYHDG